MPRIRIASYNLDIDRLHVINETFGMHVGDEVIVCVAESMAKALPPGALSARISGTGWRP